MLISLAKANIIDNMYTYANEGDLVWGGKLASPRLLQIGKSALEFPPVAYASCECGHKQGHGQI